MKDDDEQSFAVFVGSVERRLLHAADLLTGDWHRAQDLVQHGLATAYARWPSIRDGHPEAYVRRTMLNHHLDWWRRRRWRELPLPDDHDTLPGARPVDDPADGVSRRDAVQRALSVLTRRERAVIVLRYWCDLDEAQIARELRIAPGTVKSTAARALARLRTGPDLLLPEVAALPSGPGTPGRLASSPAASTNGGLR